MKSKPLSTGNDIVAFHKTNTQRTLQKRFYSRILSADEVSLFNNGDFQLGFESFIWLGWSIKESVFKFVKRHQPKAIFTPTKIIVTALKEPALLSETGLEKQESISFHDADCFCCEVLYQGEKYYTRSFINNHFVFTVANDADCFTNTFWGFQKIENDAYPFQSQSVRTFVLEKLQQQLRGSLQIEKTAAGFPFITQHKYIPLSFAHHGNYVGYSFVLG